jgi:hypothetical protein
MQQKSSLDASFNFNELGLVPVGEVRIYKKFLDGSEELVLEEKNLIVNTGKQMLLGQIYYTTGSGNPLSYAKVGVGGAIDLAGLFLKTPTSDLTDLYYPINTIPIIQTASDPTVPSITLLAVVDNSIGNGSTINEAGFFAVDNSMFNIKTFPGVYKTSAFSLNLQWVIKIN